ncbi:MAG TPA: hypothetical protein PKE63_03935 [Lacibacter sp.]|nr:hypothetical protein [Lacibacter sp.]HMO89573.1 hypothetical protein [Lacibacter sp.]HMP86400.1 hypothetical protein [Lacibacter sp.]
MPRIAGVKFTKNASGKVTHVTLSKKHFAQLIEDLEDASSLQKARKGNTVPWEDARKRINKKFGLKD